LSQGRIYLKGLGPVAKSRLSEYILGQMFSETNAYKLSNRSKRAIHQEIVYMESSLWQGITPN
jgi:hypothetical protein